MEGSPTRRPHPPPPSITQQPPNEDNTANPGSPLPSSSNAPPAPQSRSRTTLVWFRNLLADSPNLRAIAKLFTHGQCALCDNTVATGMPFVAMMNCVHDFHFSCLYTYLATAVRREPQVSEGEYPVLTLPVEPPCPVCGIRCCRPFWPSLTDDPEPPQITAVKHLLENYVWAWVHYRLQLERDKEARVLTFRPPGFQPPADIQYEVLAPISHLNNFEEMVTACWLCKRLLGNEPWVKNLECRHCFHTYCLVAVFTDRPQPSPESWPCPLCQCEVEFFNDSNLDLPLTSRCSDYLIEMNLAGFWYCLHYVLRQRRRPQPPPAPDSPPPPPPGRKRSRSRGNDDGQGSGKARNRRQASR